jgi:hypothetical protein
VVKNALYARFGAGRFSTLPAPMQLVSDSGYSRTKAIGFHEMKICRSLVIEWDSHQTHRNGSTSRPRVKNESPCLTSF